MAFSPVGHWKKVLVKTQTQLRWPISFFVAFILLNSMKSYGRFSLPPLFRDTGRYHTNNLKNIKLSQIFESNSLTLR